MKSQAMFGFFQNRTYIWNGFVEGTRAHKHPAETSGGSDIFEGFISV